MFILKNICYKLNQSLFKAKIIHSPQASGDIFIERSIKYHDQEYIITAISKNSFKGNKSIKSFNFSEDSELSVIRRGAFSNSSLTNITIPATVIQIGESCFFNCKNLQNVTFPPSLRKIDDFAFKNCNFLKSILFTKDSELRSIGEGVFFYSNITKFVIPPKLRELKKGWCQNSQLVCIELSEENKNFKMIEDKFLLGKTNEKRDNFDLLLFVRRDLKEVKIPSCVKEIGSYAFSGCFWLHSIVFDENSQMKKIGELSFVGCLSLEKISIPENVDEIEEGWCHSKITNFSISEKNKKFLFHQEKILLGKSEKNIEKFDSLLFAKRSIEHVIIPSFVNKICALSFYLCTNLKSVEFEEKSELKIIGKSSFNRSTLKSIIIPSSVVCIEDKAFLLCDKLQSVEFEPNSKLKIIKDEAFYLSAIEQISIPSNVTYIGNRSFSCGSLKTIEFSPNSQLSSIDKEAFALTSIKKIVIPSKISVLEEKVFSACKQLESVEFEQDSNLNVINAEAFIYSSVERISIPPKVKEIKDGWCKGVSKLNKIELSSKNNHFSLLDDKILIGKLLTDNFDVVLCGCRDIKSVIIPSYIKRIGSYSFYMCKNIQKVEFASKSHLFSIGESAFAYSSIEKISIPSNVCRIEESAFVNCNIKSIHFPSDSKLSFIGKNAFNLSCIEYIAVPKNVEKIETDTFRCKKLRTIEFLGEMMLIEKDGFLFMNISMVSFPNAIKIKLWKNIEKNLSNEFILFAQANANINFD
ncbi:hypothetical protein M9Y10_025781 [Tritrichomonas musculus]|uniref:Surface antigen BspA-like n=1 Tax=Tritrichomonas musculus TaxID=1915356 RepID=A0ABR2HC08_9EUKA